MPKKPQQRPYREVRLLLGDQLNSRHSWFDSTDVSVLYVMMEIRSESEYVRHHIQKTAGMFAAMRRFCDKLKDNGHRVRYWKITDADNAHSFAENIRQLYEEHPVERIRIQEPDEYRLDRQLRSELKDLASSFEVVPSEHFYTARSEVAEYFEDKKTWVMENFYRRMRKQHDVLMDENAEPAGGDWNYDKANRNKLPKDHPVPEPKLFDRNISNVLKDIKEAGLDTIGTIDAEHFIWPLDRSQALEQLEHFIEYLLPEFGTYQDALSSKNWSIYHSRISFALNLKLLGPDEIVQAVEAAWRDDPGRIGIAQAEGYIRQILGWREFMRGVYWAKMPDYESLNFFGHDRKLPEFFWTGETDMECVKKAVGQSLEFGYAHHIQRLMITGNFCCLAGIDPDAVDEWYLGIYVDAYQWVEITNTRGMSQYADGGIVGTKPYVSSASYIHKMGDHCKNCAYSHTKKTGDGACPFNSLYWHFIARNREKLESNPRMAMMYRVWDRMDGEKRSGLLDQADSYLDQIEAL